VSVPVEPVEEEKCHKCEKCDKIFLTYKRLHQHKLNVHAKIKRHRCIQCSSAFKTATELNNHTKTQHKLRRFQCHHCQTNTQTKYWMKHHLLTRHFDSKDPALLNIRPNNTPSVEKYDCHFCSQVFDSKEDVVSHFKTHRVPKKYSCDQCSTRFFNRAALHHHSFICFESDVKKINCVEIAAL
jgi:hypothetical protein